MDERRAIEAIPGMLATEPKQAIILAGKFLELIDVVGVHTPQSRERLAEMEHILNDAMRHIDQAPDWEGREGSRPQARSGKRIKHVHWDPSH
jgi:hypothetical protein